MNSLQAEVQLKQAKYQQLKEDHVKIKTLFKIAQNITQESNKSLIEETLVESLGNIICSMSFNMTYQSEIEEITILAQNVIQIMEKHQQDWNINWQNLWTRLTNLELKIN